MHLHDCEECDMHKSLTIGHGQRLQLLPNTMTQMKCLLYMGQMSIYPRGHLHVQVTEKMRPTQCLQCLHYVQMSDELHAAAGSCSSMLYRSS